MAAINTNRVWFIVRGMTHYVSRIYTNEDNPDISEEDLYLPRKLKAVLSQSLDHFKKEKFVSAHNHCVEMEDREEHVKKSFRSGLLEVASRSHVEFLKECTLYIMSATEMVRLGFAEAKDIVMDAIYQAFMKTNQHEDLILWETQAKDKENSVVVTSNNHSNQHNNHNANNNNDAIKEQSKSSFNNDNAIKEQSKSSSNNDDTIKEQSKSSFNNDDAIKEESKSSFNNDDDQSSSDVEIIVELNLEIT